MTADESYCYFKNYPSAVAALDDQGIEKTTESATFMYNFQADQGKNINLDCELPAKEPIKADPVHMTSTEAVCYWLKHPSAAKETLAQGLPLNQESASFMFNYSLTLGKV